MNIWPFNRIMAAILWKRRDRQETVVATAQYQTVFVDSGKPTGEAPLHVLLFCVDGNGVRYTHVESTDPSASKRHNELLSHRIQWKHFGIIPDHARRVKPTAGAKLTVFPGGAA